MTVVENVKLFVFFFFGVHVCTHVIHKIYFHAFEIDNLEIFLETTIHKNYQLI